MIDNENNCHYSSNNINVKAVASLIIGIISIAFLVVTQLVLIFTIFGLVLGMIGGKEIKRFKNKGVRIARAGVICNCLGIVLSIITFAFAHFFHGNI